MTKHFPNAHMAADHYIQPGNITGDVKLLKFNQILHLLQSQTTL